MSEQQKYMTIDIVEQGVLHKVMIRVSKQHPDDACACNEPGYEGEDVHNDLVMAFNIEDLRIHDGADMAQVSLEPAHTDFVGAYLEAALWSSTDDEGDPLDGKYSFSDISTEAIKRADRDCAMFVLFNKKWITNYKLAGHDFWLTRCGHGAGFWDGDWPEEAGERMTKSAEMFGNVDLYVGDDGSLYF